MQGSNPNIFNAGDFIAELSKGWKREVNGERALVIATTFYEMAQEFVRWVTDKGGISIVQVIAPMSHMAKGCYGWNRELIHFFKHEEGLNAKTLGSEGSQKIAKSSFDSIIVLQGYNPHSTYRAVTELAAHFSGDRPVFMVEPDGGLKKYDKRITQGDQSGNPTRHSNASSFKKVVLINTGRQPTGIGSMPFNLIPLVQRLVGRGHQVTVLEQALTPSLGDELERLAPDVIGVTATTLNYSDAVNVLTIARERTSARLVIGGRHATLFPYQALNWADVVVSGEGEQAIIEAVESDNPPSLIHGKPLMDLGVLPPTPFGLFDMDFYLGIRDRIPWNHLRFAPEGSRVGQLFTSRGCPSTCVFCHNSYQKLPMRFHSLAAMEAEIDELHTKWGCEYLFFFDDDFLASKVRFMEVMSLFRNRFPFLRFAAQSRVNSIDDEMAAMAAECGCIQLNFGFESGSERILRFLKNNKATLSANRRALSICKRHGIKTFCTFMIGAPDETEEEMMETGRFILEEDINDAILFITTAYPGTAIWNKYVRKKGLRIDSSPEFWEKFHMGPESFNLCETMPAGRLREIYYEIMVKMAARFNHVTSFSPFVSKVK